VIDSSEAAAVAAATARTAEAARTGEAGRTTEAARAAVTTAGREASFPDFRFAPNIGQHADIYEIENLAFHRAGHVLAAMHGLAPWSGRAIVDLGCGTGYWLPVYAADAGHVIGIEPDPALRAAAVRRVRRTADGPAVDVLAGSAEHIPLADSAADVVHARFAYFFPPGTDAGLAEVLRVLKPGGRLIVVDNDYRWGEFAELLGASAVNPPLQTAATTDKWWADRGATRHEVRSELRFGSRADLAAVLGIEFPAEVARAWLDRHPVATGLTYGYVLFAVTA
jgi:SAM-dependent methyltransferase